MIGPGRLGSAIAATLTAAGVPVVGPLGRGTQIPAHRAPEARSASEAQLPEVVLLCVPDCEIAAAAEAIAPGPIVGHCSGATGLEPLAGHECFSLHPLMTVTARGADFTGAAPPSTVQATAR